MNAPTTCPSCAKPLSGPGYRCPHCGKFLADADGALEVPEASGAFEIGEQPLEPKKARTGAVELPADVLAELQLEVARPGGPSSPDTGVRRVPAPPPDSEVEEPPLELAGVQHFAREAQEGGPAVKSPPVRSKTGDMIAGIPDRAPRPILPPAPRPFAAPRPVPKAIWVALGLVAVVLVLWALRPSRFPVVPLEPLRAGTSDPCLLRPKCVVVVVAPWCPACKMAVPVIRDFGQRFEKSEEIGFKAVVAFDKPENARAMAEQFGEKVPAYLDPQGQLMKALGEKGVPHWFVVGEGYKILEQKSGVVTGGGAGSAAQEQARVLGLLATDG